MTIEISDRGHLRDLLIDCLYEEQISQKLFKLKKVAILSSDGTEERMLERVFDMRSEDARHASLLERVLGRIGGEVDAARIKLDVYADFSLPEEASLEDLLKISVREELNDYYRYRFISEALEPSKIEGIKTRNLGEKFEELAEEEKGHSESVADMLTDPEFKPEKIVVPITSNDFY